MTNDYGNLELHAVLLAAMKDIDIICRENKLRYYLHAGTLLGAVNHGGFIPWDDDVDITMLRKEYDILADIINTSYNNRYFLQTYESDPQHSHNRSVLRIRGTKINYIHEDNNEHTEIGVDLVPLYSVPEHSISKRIQATQIWLLDTAVQIQNGSIIPKKLWTKCIAQLAKKDRVTLGKKIDKIMMRYSTKNTSNVGVLCYTTRNPYTGKSGYYNDIMPRKWYQEPVDIPFEDSIFMTISDIKGYLDWQYGPHWSEPYPEEKRITKHDVKSYYISPEVRAWAGL